MSLPATAGDTIITDGQFNNAQTIYQFNSTHSKSRDPYEILRKHVAMDALFNSSTRFDPPKCHPQTRTALLDHIDRWSKDPASPRVLWIRGGVGAGKSAIAQTLSERWYKESHLAASFYFWRTAAGRNEKKRLLPTIAYQLAISIPGFRPQIDDVISKDQDIFHRNLATQMQRIIIDPLLSVAGRIPITSKVIVIDGLDECCVDYPGQDHEQQQKEILECIHCAAIDKGFPLRFLVSSRPERQIREIFEHRDIESVSSRIVLDNSQNPVADIELYLRCKLTEIRRIHPHLGPSWPPEDVIAQLVAKSSGHFIFVAVVVRFLSAPRINPDIALKTIMDISYVPNKGGPFAEIDALYIYILRSIADDSLPTVMNMFRLMIYGDISTWDCSHPLFQRIERMSPTFVAKHLLIPLGQLYVDLVDLHSILDIPSQDCSSSAPISFLHASFSEFLTQPSRSGEFHIEKEQSSRFVLSLFVQHLHRRALCPGDTDYTEDGFGFQTAGALDRIHPDDSILEALRALINVNECVFAEYVHCNKLSNLGATRRDAAVIKSLYQVSDNVDYNGHRIEVPLVLAALKRYPVQGFVPVDPFLLYPAGYSKTALAWFCSAHVETQTQAQGYEDVPCSQSKDGHFSHYLPGDDTPVLENVYRLSSEGAQPARKSKSDRGHAQSEDQLDNGTLIKEPSESAQLATNLRSSTQYLQAKAPISRHVSSTAQERVNAKRSWTSSRQNIKHTELDQNPSRRGDLSAEASSTPVAEVVEPRKSGRQRKAVESGPRVVVNPKKGSKEYSKRHRDLETALPEAVEGSDSRKKQRSTR